MTWEWPKVDKKGLARFVTKEAANFINLPVNRHDLVQQPDGRRQIVKAIYEALIKKGVRYALEQYHPSDAIQPIRTPTEILEAPREGTCLDLAMLFCSVCFGNELLPLSIMTEGHALAAISLTHGRDEWNALNRQERELFEQGPLIDPDRLRELIDSGAYLAIECTGFARSNTLPESVPEGVGRTRKGTLPFERAVVAGREQLDCPDQPFRFALDIAVAHYHWRIDNIVNHSETRFKRLDKRLDKILRLYLGKTFETDQFARLDQTGETDLDRSTLLRQVFVDLEVKPRSSEWLGSLSPKLAKDFLNSLKNSLARGKTASKEDVLSAMKCLLQERWPMIVIIGGPGQGKSTLGQYLAQVHRADLLGRKEELKQQSQGGPKAKDPGFSPKTPRVPFRVVLKYFAQWLADRPPIDSLEAYIAELMERDTSRGVSPENVQDMLSVRPSLFVFDGLDEVIESDLRNRLLARVDEFLGRAKQLNADLQVLATSRPTGYSNQFDPERFWHLELQPMSPKKVHDYAWKWVGVKVPIEEERRRVVDTIKECQHEEHTRLLLTTPLQVTIVLLIIKDGGCPPAQREALFHEYWGTIFRREKAKAKGVIRTDEQLLFGLHAYLGYLLHCRATAENIRSLLPEAEFRKTVQVFLRKRDSRSPDNVVKQQVNHMVTEARDRLVLLVEPELGLFGFELRSLQEFFAAAYLAQTAQDTSQRFNRLKAIARSDHWHNVALFFAGRIVRNFGGEAANILELVCRPLDRDPPDRYLRRGAWLALDIAADSAFAANRDLQYSAVEYALTVLDTVILNQGKEYMDAALQRLLPEDRRDILAPLLERKLPSLPLSCLDRGLEVYGRWVSTDKTFLRGLEGLLFSARSEHVRSALNMGFQYRAEPRWLAGQLERHWDTWTEKDSGYTFWKWWIGDPQHVNTVLLAWSPSAARIHHLLNSLLSKPWYVRPRGALPHKSIDKFKFMDEPKSFTDQMIATFQCLMVLDGLHQPYPPFTRLTIEGKTRGLAFVDLTKTLEEQASLVAELGLSSTQLDRLLARSDLIPYLRAALWALYWIAHEPNEARVSAFLEEIQIWAKDDTVPESFWSCWLEGRLLGLAVKHQIKHEYEAIKRLQPYLNRFQEIAIHKQVGAAVQKLVQQVPNQQWHEFVHGLHAGEEVNGLPELIPIAETLGTTVSDLVRMYVSYWRIGVGPGYSLLADIQYTFSVLEKALVQPDKALVQPDKAWQSLWFVADAKWSLDQETLAHGKQLLSRLIDNLPPESENIQGLVVLFLKLLTLDQKIVSLAPSLLAAVGKVREVEWDKPHWLISQVVLEVPARRLSELAKYTANEEDKLREGARVLCAVLISAITRGNPIIRHERVSEWQTLIRTLRIDWQVGLPLIGEADIVKRRQGIALLTLSNFPVKDVGRCTELLSAMAKAQEEDEVEAWHQLLRLILISKSKEAAWRQLLESILSQPRAYITAILQAAMERYTALVGEASPHIEDEAALGLPVMGK